MANYSKGKIVQGTVTGIETYGIFVSLDDYYSGLIHISEVSHNFVKDVHDYVKIGDTIYVEIIGIDKENYHLNLSIKNIDYKRKNNLKRKQIVETNLGFRTLAYKLPIWVSENLKKSQNSQK